MAKAKNGQFLSTGVKIAQLIHELSCIGAYETMRKVQEASDLFHKDVEYILFKPYDDEKELYKFETLLNDTDIVKHKKLLKKSC